MSRTRSQRLYDRLLRLVPDHRGTHGSVRQEMREVFRDAAREAGERGSPATAWLWLVALLDVARTALALRWQRRPRPRDFFDATLADLRLGLRSLRTSPGFSAVVVLTLGLAIGVNSTIYTLSRLVLSPPLPIDSVETLVFVRGTNPELNRFSAGISSADLADLARSTNTLSALAAFTGGASYTLTGADEPVRLNATRASANLFDVFGTEPALGRTFLPGEDDAGAADVVLLSHAAWQRYFGGNASVVGSTITLNGSGHAVIGVLPESLDTGGLGSGGVWVPLRRGPGEVSREQRDLSVVGRLAPGVPLEAAQAELLALSNGLQEAYPDTNAGWEARVLSFIEATVGPNAAAVFVLMSGAVMFILLIACANVANLMLARAAVRRQELAVRQALGARRARLVRQLLTESAVLAVLSAAAGVLFARWTLQGLVALGRGRVSFFNAASIDAGVLGFALALALLTPLIFGVIPALRSTSFNLAGATRQTGGSAAAPRRRRMLPSSGGVLAALQVALAVVLLVVASLATRSVIALLDLELGFARDNLVTARVELPPPYQPAQRSGAFFDQALANIEGSAAIERAAWASRLPLVGGESNRSIAIEGMPAASEADVAWVATVVVTPGYFTTLDIPLLRGRVLAPADNADARPTALVSDAAVQRYWHGADPVGARVKLGGADADGPWIDIVGVVGDVRNSDADQPPAPQLYLPLAQHPSATMALLARTTTSAPAAIDELRRAIWAVDPDQPIDDIRTMGQVLYDDFAGDISAIGMMVFFSFVALALASAGVYAVIAFTVSRRAREIGIRMALGARRGKVMAMVLRQGITPVLAGLLLGLGGGFVVSQLIAGTLFGVSPQDPVTFLGVPGLLLAVGVVASLVPALRATRVDPLQAVRAE